MSAIDENRLHAYVDGQLDPAGRAEIEKLLAADADAAARVAAYRAQNAALHGAFDSILREPVPPGLMPRRRPIWRSVASHAAAALLFLALGAAGGWYFSANEPPLPPAPQVADFAERAAIAHAVFAPEVTHPVEVAAEQSAHLNAWLSKRLGTKVQAPSLLPAGFELIGGRLLPDAHGAAAQYMYQDTQGRRVTLYIRVEQTASRETAFRWVREGRIEVCFWVDGPVGYALASEIDRKEIYRVAKLAYQQINPAGAPAADGRW